MRIVCRLGVHNLGVHNGSMTPSDTDVVTKLARLLAEEKKQGENQAENQAVTIFGSVSPAKRARDTTHDTTDSEGHTAKK